MRTPSTAALPVERIQPDIPYVVIRAPGVLVFADDPLRRADLVAAIAHLGGRVVANGPLADAAAGLDRGGANLVFDIGGAAATENATEGGEALDHVLDQLNLFVRGSRRSAVVLTTLGLLDRVVARIDDPGVAILVDAGRAERDAALAGLDAALPARVAEEGGA